MGIKSVGGLRAWIKEECKDGQLLVLVTYFNVFIWIKVDGWIAMVTMAMSIFALFPKS